MRTRPRISKTVVLFILAAVVAVPTSVWAADRFTDVSDANLFHDDIAWLADEGITLGCNPPNDDRFCPDDAVTREQMAAFLHRFADTQGGVAYHARDDGFVTVDAGSTVEVLRLDVPAGSYVIDARAGLNNNSVTGGRLLGCELVAGSDRQVVDGLFLAPNNEPGDRQEVTFGLVHAFESDGAITLECTGESGFSGNVVSPSITATSVAGIGTASVASSQVDLDPDA